MFDLLKTLCGCVTGPFIGEASHLLPCAPSGMAIATRLKPFGVKRLLYSGRAAKPRASEVDGEYGEERGVGGGGGEGKVIWTGERRLETQGVVDPAGRAVRTAETGRRNM